MVEIHVFNHGGREVKAIGTHLVKLLKDDGAKLIRVEAV